MATFNGGEQLVAVVRIQTTGVTGVSVIAAPTGDNYMRVFITLAEATGGTIVLGGNFDTSIISFTAGGSTETVTYGFQSMADGVTNSQTEHAPFHAEVIIPPGGALSFDSGVTNGKIVATSFEFSQP